MNRSRTSLFSCLLLALLAAAPAPLRADSSGGHVTGGLPERDFADPDAPAVTLENLIASERFWPHQVAVTGSWQPAGRGAPLPKGFPGVLIRVEPYGRARIDFGRDGLYEVPIAETDLVERANRVRRGELEKRAPNFLYAIGPRLVDSASDPARPFPYEDAAAKRAFLAVFADPAAEDFAALAAALAPLRERDGLLTIFFPQGQHPDPGVRERLRSLGWTVPFLYDHLAEPYTATLLPAGTRPPAVLLQTEEGRLLFKSAWQPDALAPLRAALDDALTLRVSARARASD
jgi:hypothetical protein